LPCRPFRAAEVCGTLPVRTSYDVNYYPDYRQGIPLTRIHEFKHYHPEKKDIMAHPVTVICREYPKTWKPGDEPYYPVDTPASREKLALYQAEVAKCPNLIVGGRLGEYKYYDMDQSIGRALKAATSAATPVAVLP